MRTALSVSLRALRAPFAVRLLRASAAMALTLFVATCHSDSGGPCVGTLVFTAQPSSLTAGVPFSVTVQVQDASGNVQSCFSDNVSISVGTGPTGGSIVGTTSVAAVSGVASFTSLTITRSGGYTLAAAATGLTGGSSAGFTTAPAAATALSVTTQPTSATAGATISSIVVTVLDQFGNTAGIANNVTVAITPGTGTAGATLSGTAAVAAASGTASFSTLSINRTGTGYTLTATAPGLVPATTSPFTINPGATTKLVFTVQPSDGSAGSALSPAVVVSAQDAQSNPTPAFVGPVTLAIGANPGGGTLLGGGPVNASAGVATFSGLSINRPGAGYTLSATSGVLTVATSATFSVAIGPVGQLVFTQQPTNATAGLAIAPAVVVTALDAGSNTVTSFTGNVVMSIGTNPASGTLSGTLTVAANAGVATFNNLSIDKASQGYTLTATAGAVNRASGTFNIIAGAATQLVFSVQPVNTAAGASITPAVVVTARDAFNNNATSFANAVTVAITGGTGKAGATLSGSQLTKSAVAGVVSFSDLSIDSVGTGYTLSATATGLVGAFASASFNITPNVATQLVFTAQPTNRTAGVAIAPAVVVTARDFKGNTAAGFTGSVTVAIGNNAGPGGVLSGTTSVNAFAGVATFSTLSINKSGIGYTLTASSGALTGATSTPFNIIAGAATKLAFTVPPVNTAAAPAAITPAVQVNAQDALNNTDLTFTGTITVAIGTNAGTPTPGNLVGTLGKAAVAGVAVFNDLTIDKVGNGYTLTANATNLSGATSATFDIFANTATHLVFTVQPTNEVAGVSIAPAVVVSALDASNNVVPVFTGGITVAITPLTGDPAALLSGGTTVTVTASAGVATFNALNINKTADGYTLDASAGGLTGATSALFNITPAAATHLAFSTQPSGAVAGVAIAPVSVAALDAFDNVDTAYTTNIAVVIGTNPPPGTGILSGTTSVPAVNGVAVFSTLSINRSAVGYTLLATSGTLTVANSAAFTITHAALSQLVFTAPPANTVAGASIPAVAVSGQDQFGNTVTSFVGNVDMAIGNNAGPGGVLSGGTTQAAVGGVASFGNLSINKAGSGYTLSASTAGLAGAFASAAFDITAGAASMLTFTVQPGSTTAGTSIASIVVAGQDGLGNTVPTFTDNITLAIGVNGGTPAPGTLAGTTLIAASSGLATFSNLSINKSGPGYTLSATAPSIAGAFASVAFNINAGAATQLVYTTQPLTATAGPPATIPTVVVSAQDALFNTDPTFTGNVTVAIGTNGGTPTPGNLTGSLTVTNATAGVATFASLSIDKQGPGYTLAASTSAGGVTGATSTAFNVNAGAATILVITQQPSNAVAGASIVPAVTVEARDNHANVDPTFGSLVTLEFVTNAGSPVLGTLANATAMASLGIATFPTLNVNKVGTGYTIRAAASGGAGASATSSAFNITPGLANNLAFTVQPSQTTIGANISPAVRVTVRDINDNTVTSFSGNVAVDITPPNLPGGALGGTLTKAAVAGVATFSALDINVGGSYQLTATSGTLTAATSTAFSIIASDATQLVFTVHPKTATAGAAIKGTLGVDVEVTARDASGQTAAGFTGDITLSITPNTGSPGALLIGANTTAPAVGGVATFPSILIEKSGTAYKLTATAVGVAEATSGFFSINHDMATDLVFKVQPSNATVNAAIAPPVEVKAVDQFGNTATGFTADVTVASPNALGGTLSGTLTKGAVQGVATFNNLSLDVASIPPFATYVLFATTPAAGVTMAASNQFDITSSASNRLVVTIQPPNPTTAGAGFSVQVTAQDAVGATLIGFANDVTLSITSGTGTNGATLSTITTVTPVSGVANFSNLSIDKTGFGYTLSATANGIAGATTNMFTINAGAASQVDFIVDPTTTGAGLAIQPAVQVEVADALGNRVTNFVGNVAVEIFTNPSGGTLSGTDTVAVSSGVASFNNLSIDAAGTGYRLQASSGALATDVSSAFSITAGTATQLIFTVAPSNQTAGIAISPAIRVTALDALGNVAPTFGGDVTLAITAGTGAPGATLSGLLTQTASLGVATFPGLSIDKAAVNYTLSATTTTPAVTGITSATFAITHATATHLVFTVQPSNTAANASITPAVQVTARDQFENLVTAFVGNVTVAMGTNAGGPGSALDGTLIQPVTNGVATFGDLNINNVGVGYTITAQTGAFPLAGSAAFNIF